MSDVIIDRTYNARDAAAYLGIHVKTLYKYCVDGTIPRDTYLKKPGNRYAFSGSALDSLLERWDGDARKVEAASPRRPVTTELPRDSRGRRRHPGYRE
jgi:predicted DNA-binding transcriptional regulator AlpA